MAAGRYQLWALPHSLYAGKARSYLTKKGIGFDERMSSDPRFLGEVVEAVGHRVLPVLETPAGELIQDTSAIIDHCEAHHPEPVLCPPGGVQRVVAAFLDAFGSNYLLPLAMHYRWSYREQQELFLRTEFARGIPIDVPFPDRLELAGKLMARFNGFLPNLGVTPEAIPAMEESYRELLAVLEAHLRVHPYLLGGRPSLADFGMMAPLYAHLARDPVPAFLMRTTAPSVARWTERMNTAAIEDTAYPDPGGSFPGDDAIPDTLEPVLALAFADWTPGLRDDAAQFERWLATLPNVKPGSLVSHDGRRQVHPHVGRISYAWRGTTIERASQPHSLWHLARARKEAAGLASAASERLRGLLERTGGAEIMAIAPSREITRKDNVLVLA
jgi:glutathione S-transferase